MQLIDEMFFFFLARTFQWYDPTKHSTAIPQGNPSLVHSIILRASLPPHRLKSGQAYLGCQPWSSVDIRALQEVEAIDKIE